MEEGHDLVKAIQLDQMTSSFRKNNRAISKIVPIIILIMIVAVVAYVLDQGALVNTCIETPTVGMVSLSTNESNFSVSVEKVDPDSVSINLVYYLLLDEAGAAIPGIQGSLTDIYQLDLENETTNITFIDNDLDEKLSAGDMFLIKHQDHGGQASEGYHLLLKFELTGDKMNGGGTILC